jgi:hypothetical protein
VVSMLVSATGGLVVSMLVSATQDRGFKPYRRLRIFWDNRSSACRPSEGSKAVCLMSQICGLLKIPPIAWKSDCLAKFDRPFITHNFTSR